MLLHSSTECIQFLVADSIQNILFTVLPELSYTVNDDMLQEMALFNAQPFPCYTNQRNCDMLLLLTM
jgi:hypothetical protein